MKNVSNSVAGLGLVADADAVAAAAGDRGNLRASRDGARAEAALGLAASSAADAGAEAAKVALERIAAEKVAAKKAAAAKAAADKQKKEAERKRRLALAQRWIAPFHGYTLTSGYGWRWGRMHPAQDLAAPTGTPVHSMSSGTVIFSGWSNEGYGYMVEDPLLGRHRVLVRPQQPTARERRRAGRSGPEGRLQRQHGQLHRPAPAP